MSAEVQLQMRRNIEQMHAAAEDLDSWLGDIGKRDASLRGKAAPGNGASAADDETDEEEEAREIEAAKQELRELAAAQEAAAMQAAEQPGSGGGGGRSDAPAAKKKGPLTHAQKYGQWDKYDAEGVVKQLEEREAEQERLRKEVVRLENQRAQSRARKAAAAAAAASDALKAQGNEAFGAARYEEAVGLYTDALGHAPHSSVLYSNRALALLKLHAYAEAEEDCDAALLVDGTAVKAWLRRAQSRHAQSNYEGALEDLERALDLEPRNSAARTLMAECRRLKALATPKPKPVMTRVAVEEVEYDPDNDGDPFVEALAAQVAHADGEANGEAAVPPPPKPEAGEGASMSSAVAEGGDGAKQDSGGQTPHAKASESVAARPRPVATPTAESFALPATLADVERAWRSLRATPAEFAAYVRRVEPERMRSLFKSNLPSEVFSAILAALDAHISLDDAPRTLAIMRALTSAGRFSILTMCLEKADRKAIDDVNIRLIEAQGRGEIGADEDLGALRKAYE
jgi:tetratricopeptide (TPR) repeat protein